MIGTFRWNLATGIVGFLGTLLISMPHNILKTALTQSCYSFVFLFLFTFVVRWLLGTVLRSNGVSEEALASAAELNSAPKGQTIDLATPDDGSFPGMAPAAEDGGFSPLNPPKLTTKMDHHPEELVKAFRQMTEE